MPACLIQHGRVIDPAGERQETADLLIVDGVIQTIAPQIRSPGTVDRVIDARNRMVCPGFIDLHASLRDPGYEEDENTATGTAAALAGGFTTICALPDTLPVVDNRASCEFVVLQAARAGNCRVLPIGAVTRDCAGMELADLGQLVASGAVAFSDAKTPVSSAEVLRRALEYARMLGTPIFTHPQDPTLTAGGAMHESYFSTVLGLRGMPAAAEEIMVGRDLALSQLTAGRVHLMCVSTRNAVEQVRIAKAHHVAVTCDVSPHHLALTDEAVRSYDPVYKVAPPLRSAHHVEALVEGLRDGTIDAICSDHQPFAAEKKEREFDQAPFGIVGLETLLPVCVKTLIEPGRLTWPQLIEKLTLGPARVLGIESGRIREGAVADLCIVDPDAQWTIDPAQFRSKSRNSPFAGWSVRGRVDATIVGGEVRFARRV